MSHKFTAFSISAAFPFLFSPVYLLTYSFLAFFPLIHSGCKLISREFNAKNAYLLLLLSINSTSLFPDKTQLFLFHLMLLMRGISRIRSLTSMYLAVSAGIFFRLFIEVSPFTF